MSTIIQGIRFSCRTLSKTPGLTIAVVITLALGIGINAAVFSLIHSFFIQPLPGPNTESIVHILGTDKSNQYTTLSYPNYEDIRDQNETFSAVAAHRSVDIGLHGVESVDIVRCEIVTGKYFSVFNVNAALGRTIREEDDITVGAHPVVVISTGLWKRQYGENPDIIGQFIKLNGSSYEIVGVAPQWFAGAYPTFPSDVWVPMMMYDKIRAIGIPLTHRGWGWLKITGRLKQGVPLSKAQAELKIIATRLEKNHPRTNQDFGISLVAASALPDQLRESFAGFFRYISGVSGLILLVTVINVASIMLVRIAGRRREFAVRQALGASRFNVVKQCWTESILLSLAGGALGILFAVWLCEAIQSLRPSMLSGLSIDFTLDWLVLGGTLLVVVITGLAIGTISALRTNNIDVMSTLKGEGNSVIGGLGRSRLQSVFVTTQIAVSFVLIVLAGLLLRTVRISEKFDVGFDTNNILLADVNLNSLNLSNAEIKRTFTEVTKHLRQIPGVHNVTTALSVPLGNSQDINQFRIPNTKDSTDVQTAVIDFNQVGLGYFSTMGIRLIQGREFEESDAISGAKSSVIINETLARTYWKNKNPVGELLQSGDGSRVAEILGVVADIKYYSIGERPLPFLYMYIDQTNTGSRTIHLRTTGDSKQLQRVIQAEIMAVDPRIRISNVQTLSDLRRASLYPQRALGTISTSLGLLALVLTCVGIYGMVSHSVTRRTREIGIRMALGAHTKSILKLILGNSVRLSFYGLVCGSLVAGMLSQLISGLLFGIGPIDPLTFITTSVILLLIATITCYIPARRATKVDPMIALRCE